jgi:hypothetical protein
MHSIETTVCSPQYKYDALETVHITDRTDFIIPQQHATELPSAVPQPQPFSDHISLSPYCVPGGTSLFHLS